jgi:hypothetical protein
VMLSLRTVDNGGVVDAKHQSVHANDRIIWNGLTPKKVLFKGRDVYDFKKRIDPLLEDGPIFVYCLRVRMEFGTTGWVRGRPISVVVACTT